MCVFSLQIKFLSHSDLLQYFSDYQLPTSLGGNFHPHPHPEPAAPFSQNHASSQAMLPQQHSHPQLGDHEKDRLHRDQKQLVSNLVDQFDCGHRDRSNSGSVMDKAHHPHPTPPVPPSRAQNSSAASAKQKLGIFNHSVHVQHRQQQQQQQQRPVSSTRSQPGAAPQPPHRDQKPTTKSRGLLHQDGHDKKASSQQFPPQPPLPYQHHARLGGSSNGKVTPSVPGMHASLSQEEPHLSPMVKSDLGIAHRIRSFELDSSSTPSSTPNSSKAPSQSKPVANSRVTQKGGRPTRPLVPIQIQREERQKEEREREKEREREREQEREEQERKRERKREERRKEKEREEERRKREERVRANQREREKQQQLTTVQQPAPVYSEPVKKAKRTKSPTCTSTNEYEPVDIGPMQSKVSSSPAKAPPEKQQQQEANKRKRNSQSTYQNVVIQPSNSHSSEAPRMTLTPADGHMANKTKETTASNKTTYENVSLRRTNSHSSGLPRMASAEGRVERKAKGGVAPKSSRTRHDYENIAILTAAGPIPYQPDNSSSDDDADFSGDESPAPQEAIYENYGFDKGNRMMTADELEKHLAKQEKRGISAEYLRIKNEPLSHSHKACK